MEIKDEEIVINQLLAKPFLRWTGSKNWLVKDGILNDFQVNFENYHEPFLGGGAVFFQLATKGEAYLSDLNEDLINTYIQIRDNVQGVIDGLKKFINTQEEYYRVRSLNVEDNQMRAAKFIYLNRTSFNGIYRVNVSVRPPHLGSNR